MNENDPDTWLVCNFSVDHNDAPVSVLKYSVYHTVLLRTSWGKPLCLILVYL